MQQQPWHRKTFPSSEAEPPSHRASGSTANLQATHPPVTSQLLPFLLLISEKYPAKKRDNLKSTFQPRKAWSALSRSDCKKGGEQRSFTCFLIPSDCFSLPLWICRFQTRWLQTKAASRTSSSSVAWSRECSANLRLPPAAVLQVNWLPATSAAPGSHTLLKMQLELLRKSQLAAPSPKNS